MVIVDTNIIIDHIRQPHKNDSYFSRLIEARPNEKLAASMITIQELYVGKSMEQRQTEHYVLSVINSLEILPYEYEVAKLAGEIERYLHGVIEFPDVAIAATAIYNNVEFFTLNQKDFQGIKALKLYKLEELNQ